MAATAARDTTANTNAKNIVANPEIPISPSSLVSTVGGPMATYDRRRTREFYRYYHPFQVLSDRQPPYVDLSDAAALVAHIPQASPDKALTAFCQLVAVKLRVQRAMLFFFDDSYGHVLAEATCSLSLQRDSIHDPDDGLWLGHATIPKGISICEHTTCLPANNGSNSSAPSASRLHIVNDLQKDVRFKQLPYVTSGPLARFYAGAPIITPAGFNVGALCALGAEAREGLSDGEVDFLTDMAATVMDHLEALRARAEYKRGTQMIAGLSAFVQGASVTSTVSSSTAKAASSLASTLSSGLDGPTHEESSYSLPHELKPIDGAPEDSGDPVRSELIGEEISTLQEQVTELEDQVSSSKVEQPSFADAASSNGIHEHADSSANRPYQTAASIAQKTLDLDGVLFFDTFVSTFGGLAGESRRVSTQDVSDSEDSITINHLNSDHSQQPKIAPNSRNFSLGLCRVLAAAHADGIAIQHGTIRQKALRALCRRYPRGHIWSFSCDDSTSSSSETTLQSSLPLFSTSEAGSKTTKRARRQFRRKREYEQLASLIPGVQCLALVPIRDIAGNEWRAGAILYSLCPQRTFSQEGELNFMAALGDLLVAELARTETEVATKAKSAFTSLLSHELRTPLHGILGTVEQLYEETCPSVAAKMISQIELCGRTLLDVLNYLLDFSQVSEGVARSHIDAPTDASNSDRDHTARSTNKSLRRQLASSKCQVALDHITAETVEACIISHRSTFSSEEPENSGIMTTLQITPINEASWAVHVNEGAWKRICLNLVSNALKFTAKGHVSITLKQKESHKGKGKIKAVLCIEDTGRGMCKEYMSHSLFVPFTQEDTFVPGAGLGMNIVVQLVQSMGGKVDVQSHLGTGTKVTVSIPLELANDTDIPRSTINPTVGGSATAALLGYWPVGTTTLMGSGRSFIRAGIERALGEMGVTLLQSDAGASATFVVLLEDDLLSVLHGTIHYKAGTGQTHTLHLDSVAIMLICKTHASARSLESLYGHQSNRMSFVPEPYSPAQIARAVVACVDAPEGSRPDDTTNGQISRLPPRHPTSPFSRTGDTTSRKSVPLGVNEPTDDSSCTITQRASPQQRTDRQALVQPAIPHVPVTSPDSRPNGESDRTRGAPPKMNGQALRILIVDDNDVNLHLLSTYCKKKGYRSSTATDGQQAVDQYKQAVWTHMSDDVSSKYVIDGNQILRMCDRPQVILLDINMPVMDGFEAAQLIRQFEQEISSSEAALIIAMTGLSSAKARQQAFASGIDLFFSKPVKLRELTEVLTTRFERE